MDLRKRYRAACHAMQSGVAMMMNYDPKPTEPKHLRVGVNSALCDQAALVKLLVNKGVITRRDYEEALVTEMKREVAGYEEQLRKIVGANITLE